MTPDKALDLVGRYSRLTRGIKDLTGRIGYQLDKCKGLSGKRLDPFHQASLDAKNRDTDLHLTHWYTPTKDYNGAGVPFYDWDEITLDEHGAQCCHCYEAHLLIQQRKQSRKELGRVKASMTRSYA